MSHVPLCPPILKGVKVFSVFLLRSFYIIHFVINFLQSHSTNATIFFKYNVVKIVQHTMIHSVIFIYTHIEGTSSMNGCNQATHYSTVQFSFALSWTNPRIYRKLAHGRGLISWIHLHISLRNAFSENPVTMEISQFPVSMFHVGVWVHIAKLNLKWLSALFAAFGLTIIDGYTWYSETRGCVSITVERMMSNVSLFWWDRWTSKWIWKATTSITK